MKTRCWLTLAFGFLVACSASPTQDPAGSASARTDISGIWHIIADTPSGVHEATMFVAQAGKEMNGRFEGDLGVMHFAGTVEASEVRFAHQAMAGSMRFDYTGRVSDDAMTGSATFGNLGTGTWTAKRVSKQ